MLCMQVVLLLNIIEIHNILVMVRVHTVIVHRVLLHDLHRIIQDYDLVMEY